MFSQRKAEIFMNNSPHAIDLQVGANIRSLRLRSRVSQEALAERLGITFQQVQKYEKGANRISASRMVMVCRALGCEIGDLFEGTEDVSLGSSTDAAPLPSRARQSQASMKGGQLLDAISRKQRTAVLSLLRTLAKSGSTSDDEGEIDD
ncbi:helix-turn-helix domain-containing protein [Rhizobium sp. HT1-10]|uniref:helix-turn-helix domain-containing protein n=1 Tax=Rhizobium sp. HT1-10 TaxID=3111638 RepID=UPI003C2F519D